jgi:hypothetical protein
VPHQLQEQAPPPELELELLLDDELLLELELLLDDELLLELELLDEELELLELPETVPKRISPLQCITSLLPPPPQEPLA